MHVPFVPYKTTTTLLKLLVAFTLLFSCGEITHAADISISPSTGSYSVGQSFTVTIQTNPQGKSVNAVEAKLSFDNTKISVTGLSKTGSVFSLWTTEPTFSNSAGTIDFGGGSPSPFTTKSNLITVTFKAIAEGSATVSTASASVLAADGLGTDVYTGPVNASYTLTTASTPTPAEETPTKAEDTEDSDATITFGDPPRAPEAGSTVFLDPELWYPTKVGVFTWEVPFDVDVLALDISTSSEFEPVTVYDPPIEQLSLNEELLTDGVQYLTMQYKNQVGWGAILHRKIMVDTTPPLPFIVNVRAGNSATAFPLLTFEARDETSGVVKYEMSIADGEPVEITPDEAKLGYLLKDLEDGTYTVKVVAHDFAGNKTESSSAVLITAGWHPPVEVVASTSIWDYFKGKNLAIIILLIGIIGLIAYIAYMQKMHEHREQKLRKETKEIQEQMEKIFSALRDEIYDQINMITKHERLSKKEKEAVEGLNQALEVSETLIEKEITDVSKILK
ncbi:MAG: cohesin domain-containing protein [Candidatus Kaiserbacteria bacterium]|nr:cohesin domain-containing protein [Candidatus Kaiserbacteria bacterium]